MPSIINLPLMETVRRSFLYVVKNSKEFLKITSVFIILWIAEIIDGLPFLCSANESYCRDDLSSNLIGILLYIAATVVSVSIIRHIILKEETKYFHLHFGKNNLRFIGYNLLIAAMIIVPTALILMIGEVSATTNASSQMKAFASMLSLITIIGLAVFCCRLVLIYGGASIDDKEMTLGKSYHLTRGNTLKICIGQILLSLPMIIAAFLIFSIYNVTSWGIVGSSIFVLLGIMCSFFDSALKASYYCHLYQYFLYNANHSVEK